jgi:hypothetical protein
MTKVTGKAAKAANYTQNVIDVMADMYTGKDNKAEVSAIAKKIGKTEGSVRAKLAQLGLYEAAVKVSAKSDRVRKSDICEHIGRIANLKEAEIEGLEKATAAPLAKILARLMAVEPKE